MKINHFINKNNLKYTTYVTLGSLLSAIGVNMFLAHAKLLSGGMSGVAMLIQYTLKFPAGYTVLLSNLPLFIISYKELNKRFTILTFIGTVTYSFFLVLTKDLTNILKIDDILLYCLYGGIINGIGIGITYANHGSTGGFSIVSMIVKKKYDNFEIGQISFGFNVIIVSIVATIYGLPSALYTFLSMYVTSIVTDKIIHGMSKKKVVFIVTEKENEVCEYINSNKQQRATILSGQGLYTKINRKVLYCVVSLSHLPGFKLAIQSIDGDALISVLDASEVNGKGFSSSIL